MTDNFVTPETRRLLRRLRYYLGFFGIVLLLIGGGRILAEVLGGDLLADQVSASLFSLETLIIGGICLAVGYLLLYAMAAVGAAEPPALNAMRFGLIFLTFVFWVTLVWASFAGMGYLIPVLVLTLVFSAVNLWFWMEADRRSLWQVFGEPISRGGGEGYRLLLSMVVGVAVVIMAALGIIYGILTNRLELPVNSPDPGELLYTTSFDDFNDEWDLPQGRQSAEIVDGELVLTENSGQAEAGFYARLDSRRFSDFDLRVRTRQIAGDDDNTYGVIFRWRDFDNYYRFEISGDGFYRVSKTIDGVAEAITQWLPSDVIHKGAVTNEIRVIAKDDLFTFYINGQLMPLCTRGDNLQPTFNGLTGECVSNDWEDSYTDDAFRRGKIGLSVGTTGSTNLLEPIVVGFDNLVVIGPEE